MFVCFLCIVEWRTCQANSSFITKSGKVSAFTVKMLTWSCTVNPGRQQVIKIWVGTFR